MITFISELLLLFISFTITLKKYITEVAEVCTSFTQVEGTWMQELRGGHGAAAFPKVSSCSPSNSQNVVIFKGSLGNFSPSSSPRCLLEVDATALTCIMSVLRFAVSCRAKHPQIVQTIVLYNITHGPHHSSSYKKQECRALFLTAHFTPQHAQL